MYIFFKRLITR